MGRGQDLAWRGLHFILSWGCEVKNLWTIMSAFLIGEAFNLFNTTNILGVSNTNYSGYANVLVRNSNTPNTSGFLQSSSFGAAGHHRGWGFSAPGATVRSHSL
jgi:hypothetical protein